MSVEIIALLVPVLVFISGIGQKWYNFAQIYTLLVILGKIAVIITTYVVTQNHIGYCYVKSDIKFSIAIANAA